MMKRLKLTQVMYLLFIACAILINFDFILMAKSKPGSAIFVMSDNIYNDIYTTSKKHEYYSEYISLYQCTPQIRGLTDKNFQKSLNKQLVNASKKNRNMMIDISKRYNQDIIKDKLSPTKFEYSENYCIIPSFKPYYNIATFTYKYSGGAHGEGTVDYMVLNTETNTIVTLKDLFKPNIDYLNILNHQLEIQLTTLVNKSQIPLYNTPNDIKLSNNQNFYINNTGDIIIVFNVYEIAPYASGIIEVLIPRTNISMYLK